MPRQNENGEWEFQCCNCGDFFVGTSHHCLVDSDDDGFDDDLDEE